MTLYNAAPAEHNDVIAAQLPDELFLVKGSAQWPVYAETSESSAISRAKQLQADSAAGSVRIFHVDIAELKYLEMQREIVRERLVPKGEAVMH